MDAKVEAAAESLAITLQDWPTAEAVLRLLGERRDWKKLEAAHVRLLGQRPDPEREVALSRGLAVLYRDQLKNDGAAIEIFERLVQRDPLHADDCLCLATLHERNRRVVDALDVLDAGVVRAPEAADLYRRRFDLSAAIGDVDGAWRSAAALFLMEKIDNLDHANFYADHQLREPRTPLREVTAHDLIALRHHDEDPSLSEVLGIARVAIPKRARRTIVKTRTAEELYLLIHYKMCDLFPQYELVNEELDTLRALTFAALAMFSGEGEIPREEAAAARAKRALLEHALGNEAKDRLAAALNAFVASGANVDVAKWRHGARVSCASAAALLVGDPNLLEEFLDREPAVRDATAACFATARTGRLRAELGLGLTPPA